MTARTILTAVNRTSLPVVLPHDARSVDFDKVRESSAKVVKQILKIMLTFSIFAGLVLGAIGLKALIVMSRFNYFN